MTMVKRLGQRAAKSSIPILITGESGVGKEVIARAVHGASERAGKPFVAVNCGAIPENLVESILFGHEKGSFTGAHDKHLGKFQEASAAPCSSTRSANCRWTCRSSCCAPCRRARSIPSAPSARSRSTSASSRPPIATSAQAVKEGQVPRGPLLPPERLPDRGPGPARTPRGHPGPGRGLHPPLQRRGGQAVAGASAETMALLSAFDWPGNVRQLENSVYRAMVLADAPYLQPHDFPAISGRRHAAGPSRGRRRHPCPARQAGCPSCRPCPTSRSASSTTAAICARSRTSSAT
jgi:hypothetical protein